MASYGRRKILVNVDYVDETNVVEVLGKTLVEHQLNRTECEHLYDVYKGKQSVLNRQKDVRPEIKNTLVANHANEIVSFKTSYLLSEPIAYISRGTAPDVTGKITELNEMMYLNNKSARDKEIADDFSICGHAFRMALPNKETGDDEPPFVVYTLSPLNTYVVYSSGLGEKALCGITYVNRKTSTTDIKEETVYCVYTAARYFEIVNGAITKNVPHALGMVPIFEYVNNNARLGAFEIVETLLDAINTLASNRVDATEQAVQALMVFYNCDISASDFEELKKRGAIKIKSVEGMQSDVKSLTVDFNQADQQVQMDALYDEILRITGMPSQAMGNTSDSSNNGAAIVRNGWYNAEARAKDTEQLWRESEGHFLKLVLRICKDVAGLDLKVSDVALKFTRRNYEDLQVRSQVLTTMLGNDKIAPRLAFLSCGMFIDAEEAYTESMAWYEAHKSENQTEPPSANNVQDDGNQVEPGE